MSYEMSKDNKTFTIRYRFTFEGGSEKNFELKLDALTFDQIQQTPAVLPPWSELNFHKCSNCPLDPARHSHCPVAVSCIEVVDFFKQLMSIQRTTLRIETEQRGYSKETDLQTAVSSLLGLIMATSRCPILNKLRPMARFHLPFASMEETRYRAIAMYLLGQFFLHRKKQKPDWELKDLNKIYQDIYVVNRSFINRLREINVEDATLNAIVKLSVFEQDILITITEESLDSLEQLFQTYLSDPS